MLILGSFDNELLYCSVKEIVAEIGILLGIVVVVLSGCLVSLPVLFVMMVLWLI